ncbi:MAG: hypothetical protein ABF296_08380 [Oceanococcaceae bacterium]
MTATAAVSMPDPMELLLALWETLESESTVLDSGEAAQIQDVVERKDALCRQISLHPALAVDDGGRLRQPLADDVTTLLEQCSERNQHNGERIARRRQMVQERLARLSNQGTYGASGSMDHRSRGQWSAQA